MRRWSWSGLVVVCSLVLSSLVLPGCSEKARSGGGRPPDPVLGATARLLGRTLEEPLTVWVLLDRDADLTDALPQPWTARGHEVLRALTSTAAATQAPLRDWLSARGIAFESYWIANAVKVTARRDVIAEIGQRLDVDRILADESLRVDPVASEIPALPTATGVEWGVARVRAPEVWSTFGVRGEGIVVANIDSGVQFDHPALVRQYRGNLGNGVFDHNYNWFDPAGVCPRAAPCDNNSHGTHTMGTMVGDDGDPGLNRIGVAPQARWIAAKGCESAGCSLSSLLAAGQWLLAPTDLEGHNPSPDRRPHVINNSWGGGPGDTFYREIVAAWVAAGIFPVFAVGNSGPGCRSSAAPGNYPESYTVGAHGLENAVAPFSSRGDSFFGGIVKPNIIAPGVGVRSSQPGGRYGSSTGSSMASPHVSGVVALLWSAAPSLVGDVAATRAVLDQTAIDTPDLTCGGTPGNNNAAGEGRLDAFAATERAPRGPAGTLTGTITATDGRPLAGALVRLEGTSERATRSDASGGYTIRLAVGQYLVTASAFGSEPQTAVGVTISAEAITTQDLALVPSPAHALAGRVTDSDGNPVAGASVSILATPIPATRTDGEGNYLFPSVPDGTYEVRAEASRCLEPRVSLLGVAEGVTLDLTLTVRQDGFGYRCQIVDAGFLPADTVLALAGDLVSVEVDLPFPFPFYGQTYQRATVTPKGHIELLPGGSVNYINTPIPERGRPNAAIYAFWDDLVVDRAASVRTAILGSAPDRRFVFEWRDVAFWDQPQLRVRFGIVLSESGEITLQYTTPEPNPRQQGLSATIGLENETGTVGFQYSANEPFLTTATAIRFAPP